MASRPVGFKALKGVLTWVDKVAFGPTVHTVIKYSPEDDKYEFWVTRVSRRGTRFINSEGEYQVSVPYQPTFKLKRVDGESFV